MSRRPLCEQCGRDDCNNMNHLSDEHTQPALVSTLQTSSSTEHNLTHQLEGSIQENCSRGDVHDTAK